MANPTTAISLSVAALPKRRQTLQRLFQPITPTRRVNVFFRTSASHAFFVLGREVTESDLRLARHPSRIASVFLNYFEVWLPERGGAEFHLDKAYMHLDVPYAHGTGDEEVLALHCDPRIAASDPSALYKRGPHLHVSGNKRDISKAHIALCLTDLDQTCSDVDAFSAAFAKIVLMIDKELLQRLAE